MLKTISLTKDECRQIRGRFKNIDGNPYGDGFEEFYFKVRVSTDNFPLRVRESLQSFKQNSGKSGCCLFEEYPLTWVINLRRRFLMPKFRIRLSAMKNICRRMLQL